MKKIFGILTLIFSFTYLQAQCDAEFSYGGQTAFCTTGGTATVTHITGMDGTYTFTGAGTLALDSGTGAIDLAGSDPGSYDVTNTVTISGEAPAFMITGVVDGPLSGGVPKAVEFFVLQDIPDLSIYGFGSANNGGGTDGEEFTFPAVAAVAGEYITVASEETAFTSFFGFPPSYTDGAANINGDDAIELFCNGMVIDLYGDINTDGTGQNWEYLDSWAYRSGACPSPIFDVNDWIVQGPNALDGETTNDTADDPFPIGTYMSNGCPAMNGCDDMQTVSITISEGMAADAGSDKVSCGTDPVQLTGSGMGMWSGGQGTFADPSNGMTTYTPIAFEVGTTVTLTFSVMDQVCGNTSEDINVTIFEPAEDSEFFYETTMACPNDPDLIAMHNTGADGMYTFEVLSGGPNLALDAMNGTVAVSMSDNGVYAITNTQAGAGEILLSGVADGTLSGGQPKALEIFVLADIPDLSVYGIGIAPNGNGSSGPDYMFPAESASAGDYIYITGDEIAFESFFGFAPTYTSTAVSINGDDAIEVFQGTTVIDAYGDPDLDGTGMIWEYTDGWALRMNNTGPDGGFNSDNWTYGGVNSLEGGTDNNSANNPFPIGTFSTFQGPICPPDATTVMLSIGDDEAPTLVCPGNQNIALETGECGEIVNYTMPVGMDNCGDVVVTQTEGPASGDFIDLDDSPVTVSFEVTDASGLTSTCTFDIILVEFDSGQDALACNNSVNVSLDENCEALITADMVLEGGTYGCFEDFIIETSFGSDIITTPGTYSVTVTDPDTGISCWSDIVVEDKLNATLVCSVCPPGAALAGDMDCIFSCVDEDAILEGFITVPGPEITDNCGDAEITTSDSVTDGPTCGSRLITRTYSIIASDGTIVSSCDAEYLLNPLTTTSTQFGFPVTPINLPCGTGTDPIDIANFFDDKIDTDGDGYPDTPINPTNDIAMGPFCPLDVIEKNEGIEFGYVHYFATGCDAQSYAQPVDNSVCMLNVTYTDQEIPLCGAGCGDNIKVIRTWSVLDWCTPSAPPVTYTQVIKSADDEAPTIEADDVVGSVNPWNCTGDISLPAPTLLHDACTANIDYTISGPAGVTLLAPGTSSNSSNHYIAIGVPIGVNQFTYTASDCCGNTASTTVNVTIYDATPPVPTGKQNIIVNLTTDGNPQTGIAKIFTSSVDNGSYDGCTDVRLEIRRETDNCNVSGNTTYNADGHPQDGSSNPASSNFDPDNGEFVKFCCEDIPDGEEFGIVKVYLRVFDDGNQSGFFGDAIDLNGDGDTNDYGETDNYNETWVEVRVEGKSSPVIYCPADVTLNCDMDYTDQTMTGLPTGASLCGSVDFDVDYTPQLDACGVGFVIATYNVVGSPATTCSQRITIENNYDPFDPSDIDFPSDLPTNPNAQISCTDDVTFADPTWTAGPCDFIGFTEEVDTFFFEVDPETGENNDACFKILRQFSVIDWCVYDATGGAEGIYTGSQTIKITDNEAPELLNCDDAMFEVNDNTDSNDNGITCERLSTVLSNSALDNGDCASDWLKWQITVDTWSDGVVDYEYSSFLPTNDSNINNDTNGNGINDRYVAPTMSNEEVMVTVNEVIEASDFNHTVVWKVTDGCGNVSSCTTTFMVVDKKAPTPYCIDISTAIMENGSVELWANDFDLGATDNCTDQENLRFTFSNTPPSDDPSYDETKQSSAMTFTTCGAQDVQVYIWDEAGNADFCTVTINVGGTECGDAMMIAGRVATELGDGLADATVSLAYGVSTSTQTDENGNYAFPYNQENLSYNISVSKDDNHTNGVSTLDLVLIQRHILDFANLDSPYKVIAADINKDQNVSSSDIVELRKVVLGIQEEYENNESWVFVAAHQEFPSFNDPFPFVESNNIDLLSTDMMNEDFVAVKIGDVNATAAYNLNGIDSEVRNNNTIKLLTDDREVEAGEIVEIVFSTDHIEMVSGFQYTMEFNGLSYNDIMAKSIAISNANVGIINDQSITMSWSDYNPTDISGELFAIHVTALRSGSLSEMISITDRTIRPEIYVGNTLDINNIALEVRSDIDEANNGLVVAQNTPNPWKERTTISYTLPDEGLVNITIKDVTGKTVANFSEVMTKGTHQYELTADQINYSGVLVYELRFGDQIVNNKMILIK